MNQRTFELVLKRIYGTPNIKAETENAVAVLKAGDYFGIDGIIRSVLPSAISCEISDIKPFLTYALTHNCSDCSEQCVLDCLTRIVMQPREYLKCYGDDPELKIMNIAAQYPVWKAFIMHFWSLGLGLGLSLILILSLVKL
ncbi:unnamed protein product [Ambrosiozyma monospora]|uniref:Unnamed protein product n=1 Tax=Ambrosiozyma monospora TaxID=43982 RepID=A0A9W6YWK4_AMBMO|nr:unnamed protein product [Ambrosiozyma monospora]